MTRGHGQKTEERGVARLDRFGVTAVERGSGSGQLCARCVVENKAVTSAGWEAWVTSEVGELEGLVRRAEG